MSKKSKSDGSSGEEPTRHITQKATLELWVRSGGRCARCNKYLLEEPFFEREINLGERAHIAGWKESDGSPRGDSAVPVADRNEATNLILLCQDCHTVVDHPSTRSHYPESLLLEMKREHEERVLHLTGLARDRETAVLRVFGAIRGSMPELSRESAIRAVYEGDGRYARFPLAPDRHSIELNLGVLGDPEDMEEEYWKLGRREITKTAARVAEFVHDKQVRHLSVFAFARIPLMVLLGFELDDKIPVELYQKHRGETEGWVWPGDEPSPKFEWRLAREGAAGDEVVLAMSLSGTVSIDAVPAEVAGLAVYELRPVGVAPNPNLLRSRAALDAFVRAHQDFLASLESERPGTTAIHLLPAVPITAAIETGRHLMRHVHPEIKVYDRVRNEFRHALTINQR
ncbi:MAG: HNH endonuclease [Fimbriimonas sp.]